MTLAPSDLSSSGSVACRGTPAAFAGADCLGDAPRGLPGGSEEAIPRGAAGAGPGDVRPLAQECRQPPLRLLNLFGGPRANRGAAENGWAITSYDKANGEIYDMTEDEVWADLTCKMEEGFWDALLATPPTSTFDGLGAETQRPLRARGDRDIFGTKGLSIHEKKQVREGTLLACRAAEASSLFDRQGRPWLVGVRRPRCTDVSIFALPPFKALGDLADASDAKISPGGFGILASKPAWFRGNFKLESRHHPPDLFQRLLAAFAVELDRRDRASDLAHTDVVRDRGNQLAERLAQREVRFTTALRHVPADPKELKRRQDVQSLGGLRNAAAAVRRMPGHRVVGPALAMLVSRFLEEFLTIQEKSSRPSGATTLLALIR